MTEPLTTVQKLDMASDTGCREYRLTADVTLRDVDQEVSLTLAGWACHFERRKAGSVMTYLIRQSSGELGRLVIAPPNRIFPFVRIREVHLCPEFKALCRSIRCDLEALSRAAEHLSVKENSHFSYPRAKRRQIVAHYREVLRNGRVENKQVWAEREYHISSKTLHRYEQEFPESETLPLACDLLVD